MEKKKSNLNLFIFFRIEKSHHVCVSVINIFRFALCDFFALIFPSVQSFYNFFSLSTMTIRRINLRLTTTGFKY